MTSRKKNSGNYYAMLSDGSVVGFYLLKGRKLRHLHFDHTIEGKHRKWYIDDSQVICAINNEADILDEVFEKVEKYSKDKSFKTFYRFIKINLFAGTYYPRVYRPILVYDIESFFSSPQSEIKHLKEKLRGVRDFVPRNDEMALMAVTQLSLLIENLLSICRTIHPSGSNLNAYGNEIRNLLILSCTEVEAQLRGILVANSSIARDRYQTTDYAKLKGPLKLNQYKVQFNFYPWLGSYSPFAGWNETKATASLQWYDSYNSVKHDREKKFKRGNLGNVFNSIAANAILLIAQYGLEMPHWSDLLGQFFIIQEVPDWGLEEHYFPPVKDKNWKQQKLFP